MVDHDRGICAEYSDPVACVVAHDGVEDHHLAVCGAVKDARGTHIGDDAAFNAQPRCLIHVYASVSSLSVDGQAAQHNGGAWRTDGDAVAARHGDAG